MPLFNTVEGPDPIFMRLATAPASHEYLAEARAVAESLWARTRHFLDTDLAEKARLHFHQSFWEMYLASVLLDLGLPLVPRMNCASGALGPDLLVAPATWVEDGHLQSRDYNAA